MVFKILLEKQLTIENFATSSEKNLLDLAANQLKRQYCLVLECYYG